MSDSRFSNGVLLGIIIGGSAVFLFGTPTGRKVLKILSEEGVQGLSDRIEKELDDRLEEYDEEEVYEEVVPTKTEQAPNGDTNGHERVKTKRFFRKRTS